MLKINTRADSRNDALLPSINWYKLSKDNSYYSCCCSGNGIDDGSVQVGAVVPK